MQHLVRAHPRLSAAAVFAASFALLLLLMDRRLNIFDESLVLVAAMRTLAGDAIHRDYNTSYGPAANLILAGLFRLDGHWFILARGYGLACMSGIVAAVFGLLAPRAGLVVTLIATTLAGLWMLASPQYLYPLFPALLLALVGTALLLRWRRTGSGTALVLAGGTAGAASLFRYDAGAFLALAHGAAAALMLVRDGGRGRAAAVARAAWPYALGAAAVFLPFALAWLATSPFAAFRADIIDYTVHHYAAQRGLPFPGPARLLGEPALLGVYLPIPMVMLAAWALARRRRTEVRGGADELLLACAVLAALFYYKGLVRVSTLHMLMSIVPALPVAALLADRLWRRGGTGRLAAAGLLAASALPAGAAATAVRGASRASRTPLGLMLAATGLKRPDVTADPACPLPPAMRLASQEPDYLRMSAYLRRFTRADEPIFVGLARHDRAFANPVALYFSAGRMPGTHWQQFDPGLQTRADIQARMIDDLRRNHVRWVVRDASFDDIREPNASAMSSGVHLLDRWLDANYRAVAASGQVRLWLRNGVPAPQAADWPDCLAAPL